VRYVIPMSASGEHGRLCHLRPNYLLLHAQKNDGKLNLCMLDPDEARRMMEGSEITSLIEDYSSKLKVNGTSAEGLMRSKP
jgi:hypothetical protein